MTQLLAITCRTHHASMAMSLLPLVRDDDVGVALKSRPDEAVACMGRSNGL
jgi:hypothetical protein